jgi:hypothetical protein
MTAEGKIMQKLLKNFPSSHLTGRRQTKVVLFLVNNVFEQEEISVRENIIVSVQGRWDRKGQRGIVLRHYFGRRKRAGRTRLQYQYLF